jgi:hypothetical protein
LSVAHPVPWSAVLPPLCSLTQEPRPLRPARLSSRLRHPLWPVELPAEPRVVPVRQAEVLLVAALVQVVPEQAAPVRAVPVETRVLSVAVPRWPVVRGAEPPPVAVQPVALRQVPVVVHPWVVVLRSVVARPWVVVLRSVVVHPWVVVLRSEAACPWVAVPRLRAAHR